MINYRNWNYLLLLILAIPLGGLIAFTAASKAQVPQNLETVARQRISQRSRTPLAQLSVVTSGKQQYQNQNVFTFKVKDNNSGNIQEITLNSGGQEVNATQLEASALAAQTAQYGKLDPALAQRVTNTSANQKLRVMIWLKQTSDTPASRPPANAKNPASLSAGQASTLSQQMDQQRANAVQAMVAPVTNRMKTLDANASAEKYSPVVYAKLTPQAIQQVAAWNEVDRVYEEKQVQSNLDIARRSIRADLVNSRGITGVGVRTAQIEVGGRIASGNPYLSGTIQDTTYVCSYLNSHATAVAGIIRSTHSLTRGIAPSTTLWAGGSCGGWMTELQNRSTAAVNWGALALNLSLGGSSSTPDGFARFYDDLVINRARSVVVAAGNSGGGTPSTPAVAYNVIAVGSINDRNTTSWTDDIMSSFSSWRNPTSTSGDRQKPEVSAPGDTFNSTTNTSPWIGGVGSGTSYAAPMVTGVVAQMIQRNSTLGFWPESVKAILMTTAVQNVEGSARLSEYDGAGGVVADRADDVARRVGGSWGGQSYSCSAASATDVATISLVAGQRTRATLTWNQNPSYSNYSSKPSADLDFEVVNSAGTAVAGSYSYDNTYEIVDFVPSTSGTYTLRAKKFRCDLTPSYVGWAWRQGN